MGGGVLKTPAEIRIHASAASKKLTKKKTRLGEMDLIRRPNPRLVEETADLETIQITIDPIRRPHPRLAEETSDLETIQITIDPSITPDPRLAEETSDLEKIHITIDHPPGDHGKLQCPAVSLRNIHAPEGISLRDPNRSAPRADSSNENYTDFLTYGDFRRPGVAYRENDLSRGYSHCDGDSDLMHCKPKSSKGRVIHQRSFSDESGFGSHVVGLRYPEARCRERTQNIGKGLTRGACKDKNFDDAGRMRGIHNGPFGEKYPTGSLSESSSDLEQEVESVLGVSPEDSTRSKSRRKDAAASMVSESITQRRKKEQPGPGSPSECSSDIKRETEPWMVQMEHFLTSIHNMAANMARIHRNRSRSFTMRNMMLGSLSAVLTLISSAFLVTMGKHASSVMMLIATAASSINSCKEYGKLGEQHSDSVDDFESLCRHIQYTLSRKKRNREASSIVVPSIMTRYLLLCSTAPSV